MYNANRLISLCVIWTLWSWYVVFIPLIHLFVLCYLCFCLLTLWSRYVVFILLIHLFVLCYLCFCLLTLLILLLVVADVVVAYSFFNSLHCSCSSSSMYFTFLSVIRTLLFMLPLFIRTLLFICYHYFVFISVLI